MKKIDFEDYLMEKHMEQYIGISDDAPDDYADWVTALDPQELIDYGQAFAERAYDLGELETLRSTI